MTQELLEKATQIEAEIDRAYDLKWIFDNMDCGEKQLHAYILSVEPSGNIINCTYPDEKLCRCVSEAIEKYISKKEEEFENLK